VLAPALERSPDVILISHADVDRRRQPPDA
jgi:hypothetical protein